MATVLCIYMHTNLKLVHNVIYIQTKSVQLCTFFHHVKKQNIETADAASKRNNAESSERPENIVQNIQNFSLFMIKLTTTMDVSL